MSAAVFEPKEPPKVVERLIPAAWILTLAVSVLPDVLFDLAFGQRAPGWFIWPKLALLAGGFTLTFYWRAIDRLRLYLLALLVLLGLELIFSSLGGSGLWQALFPPESGFVRDMFGVQLLRLGVALVMIFALMLVRGWPDNFFLSLGELHAPAEPVRWLAHNTAQPWSVFGRNFAIFVSLGTLAFLLFAAFGNPDPALRPSGSMLLQALPLLPLVLLFAAMNAFSEEMNYRAALLSNLFEVVGDRHALLITAAFFGLGHYYGVPYGVVGVLMAVFLGWLLGKSMLETRGMFWAWLIHFLQDVLIFFFMALGAVVAGGG